MGKRTYVGETSISSNLGHSLRFSEKGTVLVATTRPRASQSLSVLRALPEKMPCVTRATISEAPCSRRVSAALARVPQVSWWARFVRGQLSLVGRLVGLGGRRGEVRRGEACVPAMSSTRMAHLSLTFPTRVICGKCRLALSVQDDVLLLDSPSRPHFWNPWH